MAVSTAISVASFSAVLAESFAAVMLSTLIPATFVETANTVKRLAQNAADDDGNVPEGAVEDSALSPLDVAGPVTEPFKSIIRNVAAATAEPSDLNLLLPKSATIDAEFEFHASEAYELSAEVGAQIKLVTVAAGFSALYETSSSNKVSLHVEFESVNLRIG